MTRLTISLAAAAVLAGGLAVLPTPVAAQSGARMDVDVFGTDPCPRETESQIVICHRHPESERYRLPKTQQLQGTRQQKQSWADKAQAITQAGQVGTGSCSAVGPGGREGCLVKEIQQAKQAAKEQKESDTPPQ